MNLNDEINKIFAAAKPTRGSRQRDIEDAIDRFRPNYIESAELIAAVVGSLRAWTEDSLGAELEADFKALMDSLNEADNTAQVKRYDDEWTQL